MALVTASPPHADGLEVPAKVEGQRSVLLDRGDSVRSVEEREQLALDTCVPSEQLLVVRPVSPFLASGILALVVGFDLVALALVLGVPVHRVGHVYEHVASERQLCR